MELRRQDQVRRDHPRRASTRRAVRRIAHGLTALAAGALLGLTAGCGEGLIEDSHGTMTPRAAASGVEVKPVKVQRLPLVPITSETSTDPPPDSSTEPSEDPPTTGGPKPKPKK